MDFLDIAGKTFLVFGVANRKSIAFSIGQILSEANANVVYSVRSKERRESVSKILPGSDIFVCDVEREQEIRKLAEDISKKYPKLHGIVHSIAFANYEEGLKPFHETVKLFVDVKFVILRCCAARWRKHKPLHGTIKSVVGANLHFFMLLCYPL